MGTRRNFLKKSGILSALALTGLPKLGNALASDKKIISKGEIRKPVVI